MKLIIDIPQDYYEIIKHDAENHLTDYRPFEIIGNGTPLDDVKAEIQENINYNKRMNYLGIVTGLLLALDIIDYKVGKESEVNENEDGKR
jgi:hypothetical protein